MKQYKVFIEEPAEDDLRGILYYIAEILKEPQIAINQVHHIRKAVEGLEMMPERFPLYKNEPWHSLGIRRNFNISN